MNLTNLQTQLKSELKWLGDFTAPDSVTRLNYAILKAGRKIWNKRVMRWMYSTFTLTPDGTLGPYDPPSDFHGFPLIEIAARVGWKDIQTSYIIKDNSNGQSYEIFYVDADNKLYFRNDPGDDAHTNAHTVPYIPSFDNDIDNISTTITLFPEELVDVFQLFVQASLLDRDGTQPQSDAAEQKAYAHLEIYYENYEAQQTKPKQRNVRGQNGIPYDGIANSQPVIRGYPISTVHDY